MMNPLLRLAAVLKRSRLLMYFGALVLLAAALVGELANPNLPAAQAASGTLVGWGDNYLGAATAPNGLDRVLAVSAGANHTLVLRSSGYVYGWGNNTYGQNTIPSGLYGVIAVATGYNYDLALKADGTVVAWGQNNCSITTAPSGFSGVKAIAAGYYHALALKADGTVVAWGCNTNNATTVPTGLNGVIAIAAGNNYSVALKADGTVVVWGDNNFGETNVPSGFNGVIAIAAGQYHILALKADGTVVAWGNNTDGETSVPNGLTHIKAIAGGGYSSLALRDDGIVQAWGNNTSGQITIPSGLTGVTSISAGLTHALALKGGGSAVAWGDSSRNALAVPASARSGMIMVATGQKTYVGLKNDGTVRAWGDNYAGPTNLPSNLYGVKAVAVGEAHGLALKSDGTVVGWGDNTYGQISIPSGLSGVKAIAAGRIHSMALKADGTVVVWGDNTDGQNNVPSGLNSVISIYDSDLHEIVLKADGTPVAWGANVQGEGVVPSGTTGIKEVAAGSYFNVVLKSDGTVLEWGSTAEGLGNVNNWSGIKAITGGGFHIHGLTPDSRVLGGGDNLYSENPPSWLTDVTVVSANFYNSSAVSLKTATGLSINGPVTGLYGGQLTVSATLTDLAADSGLSGRSITFSLNGSNVGTAQTDSNGTATLMGVNLGSIKVGSYAGAIGASFGGDNDYLGQTTLTTLTVNKRPLQVQPDNQTRPYGQPNPTLTVSYIGFANGETSSVLSGSPACTTTATITSTVAASPYPITCATGTLSATNYSFNFIPGSLIVTQAVTALSVGAVSAPYAGSATFTTSLSAYGSPLISQPVTLTLNGTSLGAAQTDSSGLVTFTNVSLVGIGAGTYSGGIVATYGGTGDYVASSGAADLTVNKVTLNVTADGQTRPYSAPNPTFTVSYSGFVNGEDSSVLSGIPSCSTSATITSTVAASPYPIICDTGTLSAANYAFNFVPGNLTVTVAATTLTVNAVSAPYGGTVSISATLSTDYAPIPYQPITFRINGSEMAAAQTGEDGVATVRRVTLAGIPAGTYPAGVGVSFGGTGDLTASSDTNSLTIAPCQYLNVNISADDGCGSLRQALTYANSQLASGPVTITLATSYITLTTPLPVVNNATSNLLTIAGSCQADPQVNGRGIPGTRISPAQGSAIASSGLTLTNSSLLKGVALTGFGGYGLTISGNNNQLSCAWIGTADGQTAAGNTSGGIHITGSNNQLGQNGQSQSGVLISGNGGQGLKIDGSRLSTNYSYYTWIGLAKDGSYAAALRNNGGCIVAARGARLTLGLGNRCHA